MASMDAGECAVECEMSPQHVAVPVGPVLRDVAVEIRLGLVVIAEPVVEGGPGVFVHHLVRGVVGIGVGCQADEMQGLDDSEVELSSDRDGGVPGVGIVGIKFPEDVESVQRHHLLRALFLSFLHDPRRAAGRGRARFAVAPPVSRGVAVRRGCDLVFPLHLHDPFAAAGADRRPGVRASLLLCADLDLQRPRRGSLDCLHRGDSLDDVRPGAVPPRCGRLCVRLVGGCRAV